MIRSYKWMKISGLFLLFLLTVACSPAEEPVKMVPVVEDGWWDIGPEPDLTPLGLQPEGPYDVQPNQPNDHHIFRDVNGTWHLWACVRGTEVGRILAHWRADSLEQSPWEFTGEVIRANKEAGESLIEWKGLEFIQSPYVVETDTLFYMFYGGYATGLDPSGDTTTNYSWMENQISLMTSPDGVSWERHRNSRGYSRVFAGPGAARDPVFRKFGDTWYCYYCGHHNWDRTCGAIYVRSSRDLINWSDWHIAHYDKESEMERWLPESPQVVYRKGYYYLFRTHGPEGGVYVYRSEDPMNFGHGDVTGRFVTRLDGITAPEIFVAPDGTEYISNITDGKRYGIRLTRLRWVTE